jgi:multisubunit Na+/H+ antiporter MnhE subunit
MARQRAEPGISGPPAGSGQPRRQQQEVHVLRRMSSWLAWWTLLMGLWVWLDDSSALADLLAGAAVAAMAAAFAELVSHQSATQFRAHIKWITPLRSVPVDVAKDTWPALHVLWRRLSRGEQPHSGFRVVPTAFGDESSEGVTRRALLTGGRSISPNTFVIGIDPGTNLMVVHQLVINQGSPLEARARATHNAPAAKSTVP